MKITITSTSTLTHMDGVPVRVWDGVTEDGVACKVFVHMLAVTDAAADTSAFDRDLKTQAEPRELRTISLRQIL